MFREGGDGSGADVGGDADFEGDVLGFEVFDEGGIVDGADAVADAFGADFEGLPDAAGIGDFAGVTEEAEAFGAGLCEELGVIAGRAVGFIATEAEGDDTIVDAGGGEFHGLPGAIDAPLADGVPDPVDANGALGGGFTDGLMDGGGVLVFPEDDAGGEGDLGVLNVLLFEALEKAACGDGVVLGSGEVFGDPAEVFEELGEVFVVVAGLDFGVGEMWGNFE